LEERLLLIPGPTNLSKEVRDAMAEPMISHTGDQFYTEFKETVSLARYVFRNQKGFQFVLSGAGTIGMESVIASTVERGDKVLVLETGYFGKRMATLNEIHGAKVEDVATEIGKHSDPDALRKRLSRTKYRAVFITHVETATSVMNPAKELVEECRNAGVFSIVDAVCSTGGEALDFDELGADAIFTASQKALAAPPGATLIATSDSLLEHFEKRKTPIDSYYMNLARWKPVMEDPKIYLTTPAVPIVRALRVALSQVKREGIERRWARHRALGELARKSLRELGQNLVAEEGYNADTVTAFWVRDGSASEIRTKLEQASGVVVARGISDTRDKMIRIGHFGTLTQPLLDKALEELGTVLTGMNLAEKRPVQLTNRR